MGLSTIRSKLSQGVTNTTLRLMFMNACLEKTVSREDGHPSPPPHLPHLPPAPSPPPLRLLLHKRLRGKDDIAGFRPAPEHLDYPRMLLQARGDPRGASSADQALSGPGTQAASPPPGAAYTTWYPPLRSTLQVLSKVYRAVDMGVFEDLAQLAVAACAETMKVGWNGMWWVGYGMGWNGMG